MVPIVLHTHCVLHSWVSRMSGHKSMVMGKKQGYSHLQWRSFLNFSIWFSNPDEYSIPVYRKVWSRVPSLPLISPLADSNYHSSVPVISLQCSVSITAPLMNPFLTNLPHRNCLIQYISSMQLVFPCPLWSKSEIRRTFPYHPYLSPPC